MRNPLHLSMARRSITITRTRTLLMLLCMQVACAAGASMPPLPLLPVPTARQLRFQRREMAMFLHFGMNTFTDSEVGSGEEDPRAFNPASGVDAEQWVRTAKDAGFRMVILTAKHHDGFCLWPTAFSNHSVQRSPWEAGRGDVVRLVADAARHHGLALGLYLSPWDRHERSYAEPDPARYNEFYLAQLRELLSAYGPVSEIWLDGYRGSHSPKTKYLLQEWIAVVRQLQPDANVFSDAGPDVRWAGNEAGVAGSTSWSMINRSSLAIGAADVEYLNAGDEHGTAWVPPECDVSIRPGWFWHAGESPKPLSALLSIYYQSVGRNCVLVLNVPPNKDGVLGKEDVRAVHELGSAVRSIFASNLAAASANVTASSARPGLQFQPEQVLSEDLATYWAADASSSAGFVELDLGKVTSFNVARIQEPVSLGQRVKRFRIRFRADGEDAGWKTVASGTTVGYKRLVKFPVVEARFVRLTVDEARSCPLIASFGLYLDRVSRNDVARHFDLYHGARGCSNRQVLVCTVSSY